MAFAVSTVVNCSMGNVRTKVLHIVPDSATQNVETGLKTIYGSSVHLQSAATANPSIHINLGAAGTSLVGILGISGVASGDDIFVTVYGV